MSKKNSLDKWYVNEITLSSDQAICGIHKQPLSWSWNYWFTFCRNKLLVNLYQMHFRKYQKKQQVSRRCMVYVFMIDMGIKDQVKFRPNYSKNVRTHIAMAVKNNVLPLRLCICLVIVLVVHLDYHFTVNLSWWVCKSHASGGLNIYLCLLWRVAQECSRLFAALHQDYIRYTLGQYTVFIGYCF